MGEWAFDASRYIEDVVKPVQRGWPPTENLFRVYQLCTTAGQSEVDTALVEVPRWWGRPELRAYGSGCARLRACHDGAVALLGDGGRRAAHRAAVDADLRALAEVVRHRLHGAPAMPATAVDELVHVSAHRWTRPDVLAALAIVGADQREPVELVTAAVPRQWKQLRECLADLRYPSLWHYLICTPGLAGGDTTVVETEARRGRLRVSRDRAATAETTVLALTRRWLAEPGDLAAVLRHELVTEMTGEALRGYGAVREPARVDAERCAAARLPTDPDVLAYAVWCTRSGERARWLTEYADAVAERRLTEALALLDSHPLSVEWIGVRDRLRATVDRLTGELARARDLEGGGAVEEAAARYLAVGRELSTSAVTEGLLRCRAAAPSEVTALVDGHRVLVRWTASPSTAGRIGYRVTRGATVVAQDTTELAITDTPPVATPVGYTVTTTRHGIPGGTAESPEVAVLPDVADLVLRPSTGVVEGTWRLPPEAVGVRAARIGPEGVSVVLTTGERQESFVDRHVRPDTCYTYWVWAMYPAACSPGVTAWVESAPAIRPVTDLRAEAEESTVDLSWTSPVRGRVEFRVLRRGAVAPFGVVPAAEVAGLGRLVGFADVSPVRIDLAELAGERVVVPVTMLGELAAVGDPVIVETPLAPVAGLRAEQCGPQVSLSWEWPAGAHDARVLWRRDAEPSGSGDPEAARFDVSRLAYLSRGVRVPVAGPGEYGFGVRVLDRDRSGPLRTVRLLVRPEVTYTVHKVRWGHYGTHVVAVHGSAPLPEIAVVARTGNRPLALDDGEEVLRLPGGAVSVVRGRLSVPDRLTRPVHLRAFALDNEVLLRHPDPRDLVVR
jgi:hypothetical protein